MEAIVVNFDTLEDKPVKPHVTRKTFQFAEGCTITQGTLEYGHKPGPHSHPAEQVSYVRTGTAVFNVGGVEYSLKAGDMIVIPPNVEHYIVVTSKDTPVVNMDIFTPKRSDR